MIPEIHCLGGSALLAWVLLCGNATTAVSFVSISIGLLAWARRRRFHAPNLYLAYLGAMFLCTCGIGRAMLCITLFVPLYWWSGAFSAITGLLSTGFAVMVILDRHQIYAIPTPREVNELAAVVSETSAEREMLSDVLESQQERLRTNLDELLNLGGADQPFDDRE